MFLGILTLVFGSALALFSVRFLAGFLERCSPRLWREATLPPQSHDDIHGLAVFAVCITAFTTFWLFGMLAINSFVAILGVGLSGWGGWAFVMRQRWWELEAGSLLRASLDKISQNTGIIVGRIRLREGIIRIPRVFLDGTIEISTNFFRYLPANQQEFLLAATLLERKNRTTLKRTVLWLTIVTVAFWAVMATNLSWIAFYSLLALAIAGMYFWPKLSDETLRSALEQTGDFRAAAEAVLRVDKAGAEWRLKRLRVWWNAQPKNALAASAVSVVSSTSASVQPLRRGP